MRRYASLRRQADFARLRRRGHRVGTSSLTLYLADSPADDGRSLVGISVSKSIGKAVVRNKLRRRLGAIVNDALACGHPRRLLIVARPCAAQLQYAALQTEVVSTLRTS